MSVRWWVRDKLGPLTARRVVAVEGISDRILLERVADLTNRNLDRLGISLVETSGAGDMGAIIKLFGKDGFDVPMSMLIGADAKERTASKLGVNEAALSQHSVWISDPDLEAEFIRAVGVDVVWAAIVASPLFTPNKRATCATSGPGGSPTSEDVAAFCHINSKYKVRAAMIVARVLTVATAGTIGSINGLLNEITVR